MEASHKLHYDEEEGGFRLNAKIYPALLTTNKYRN